MAASYPDELEADMQEFFGLDIGAIGNGLSVRHAAVCASQLPRRSRVMSKIDPACAWGESEHLAANAVDLLGMVLYAVTGAGVRNYKPLLRPGECVSGDICPMDTDDLDSFLSRPRKAESSGD